MAFEDKVVEIAEAIDTIITEGLEDDCKVELFMRARTPKHPPVLWIDMGLMSEVAGNSSIREQWEQLVTFVAVVKNANPKEGRKEAMRIAAKARRLLMAHANNNLGLSYVLGCSGGTVLPDSSGPNEGDLYTANATIYVKFYTCD